MSRKTKTTSTKEEARPAFVPKLRFPEFRGAALRSVQLGDVTEEGRSRNGKKHSVASVMGVTKVDGIVPMEARLIAPDIARYKLVQHDWFAYNPMRLNIGSIARWKGESEILVSPDYVVFKCITDDESGIAPGYLDQFRQTKTWEEFVTEGGDGSVRVRIYYKDIARVRLALPTPAEQQKIAECLSSVDELIAAQARKLESLKTHKKGLMQQLFPREGETQPRLRFPEFQNAGEWEEGTVSDFAEINPRREVLADDVEVSFVPMSVVSEDGFLAEQQIRAYGTVKKGFTAFRDNDVIIAKITPCFENGKAAYVTELTNGVGFGSTEFHVVRTGDACLPKFLFSQLYTEQFRRAGRASMTGSGGQQRVPATFLEQYPIQVPKLPEQHRIAECLSSLDALIAAETQKQAALQRHKRGLMQQLFPSPEDTTNP